MWRRGTARSDDRTTASPNSKRGWKIRIRRYAACCSCSSIGLRRIEPCRCARARNSLISIPCCHALSVDIEDWFQVGAFERVIDRSSWDAREHRVEANGHAVLDLFADAGVKATLFTLGWVAKRYPAIIRRAVSEGHEIASHGWDHARVFTMTPAVFRADIARTRQVLQDVQAPRSPAIARRASRSTHARRGRTKSSRRKAIAYSSSVAPVKHDHYGWPEAPRFAFRPVAGADLIELPVTTAKLGRAPRGRRGGFFRLLPDRFSSWAIDQVSRSRPPGGVLFPPVGSRSRSAPGPNASVKSKMRHYSRLSAMSGKLKRLMKQYEWDRTDAVAAREAARTP